ncbi:MAG: hypothetical protein IKT15_02750 [Firmicutes bacterium]|nr:hypothetical protein [Bacillota bacterium]
MRELEIIIDEIFTNQAAHAMVEALGEIPVENEALFTSMRAKKQLKPRAAVEVREEEGLVYFAASIGDVHYSEKDILPEAYFLEAWADGYRAALLKEVRVQSAQLLGGIYVSEPKTMENGGLTPEEREEVKKMFPGFDEIAGTVYGMMDRGERETDR